MGVGLWTLERWGVSAFRNWERAGGDGLELLLGTCAWPAELQRARWSLALALVFAPLIVFASGAWLGLDCALRPGARGRVAAWLWCSSSALWLAATAFCLLANSPLP